MSMRGAFPKRTLCEVLREINDILNKNEPMQPCEIRKKLIEAEVMAKKMSHKLRKYNKSWDAKWWEDNKDYDEDFTKRMNNRYIVQE